MLHLNVQARYLAPMFDRRRMLVSLVAELDALGPGRFTRALWLESFDGLPDDELLYEADVLGALGAPGGDPDAVNTYCRAVFRRAGSRLEGPIRVTLAHLVSQKRLTPSALFDEVDGLLDRTPEMRLARHRDLRAMGAQPSLATVHSILAGALRKLPAELWPEGPLHRGELRPDIGKANYPVLAALLADHVEIASHRERLLDCAEREAAIDRPDMAGSSLRPGVLWVTKALAKKADGDDPANPCTAFLRCVDEGLRKLDVANALEKRKQQPSSPVARAIWRGDDGTKVRIWLAQLEDGAYGLLYKPKSRYAWLEGDRESVLASLPDAWFGEAMAAEGLTAR